MKLLVSLFVSASLIASLVACSKDNDDKQKYTIFMSQSTLDDINRQIEKSEKELTKTDAQEKLAKEGWSVEEYRQFYIRYAIAYSDIAIGLNNGDIAVGSIRMQRQYDEKGKVLTLDLSMGGSKIYQKSGDSYINKCNQQPTSAVRTADGFLEGKHTSLKLELPSDHPVAVQLRGMVVDVKCKEQDEGGDDPEDAAAADLSDYNTTTYDDEQEELLEQSRIGGFKALLIGKTIEISKPDDIIRKYLEFLNENEVKYTSFFKYSSGNRGFEQVHVPYKIEFPTETSFSINIDYNAKPTKTLGCSKGEGIFVFSDMQVNNGVLEIGSLDNDEKEVFTPVRILEAAKRDELNRMVEVAKANGNCND
jgi:hypothetical protein